MKQIFEKNKSSRAESKSRTQFLRRIAPGLTNVKRLKTQIYAMFSSRFIADQSIMQYD